MFVLWQNTTIILPFSADVSFFHDFFDRIEKLP